MDSNFHEQLDLLQEQIINSKLNEELAIATNKNFLRYFLRSKGNVPEALQMVGNYVKWRNESNIGFIDYEVVRHQLEKGKISVLTQQTPASDVLVIFVSKLHYPRESPTIDFLRSIVYLLELFMTDEQEHSGFIVLNDLRDVGKSNFDFKISNTMHGLQTCVPILPKKILMYKPPLLFNLVWKIVRPYCTHSVRNLIEIVKSPQELLQYINANNLYEEYGGNLIEDRLGWLSSVGVADK